CARPAHARWPGAAAAPVRRPARAREVVSSWPDHPQDAREQPATRLTQLAFGAVLDPAVGDAPRLDDVLRRHVLGPNPTGERHVLLVLVHDHRLPALDAHQSARRDLDDADRDLRGEPILPRRLATLAGFGTHAA